MARQKSSTVSARHPRKRRMARRCVNSPARCRCHCCAHAKSVMRQFRPSLRANGLTEQQWRILRALSSVGSIEVTELARLAFLLGPSLSRILRDLEARDLVERKTAETDQRRAVVSISAQGIKLIELIVPTSEAIYEEITRRYGIDRLAELQDMLGVLEQNLARIANAEAIEADAAEE